jgi:glycosyltransferase involved in cell wall biosynthesis
MFVIGTLDIGGAERQLVELATHLDPAFEPVVCCLSAGGPLVADLERAGIPVFVVGLRGRVRAAWSIPARLVAFVRHVRGFRPAVLHGILFHAYVLSAFTGALLRVPAVIASRRSLSNFKQSRRFYFSMERLANRWTDAIIANSEAVRRDAIVREGLAEDAVSVVYNGFDWEMYDRPPDPRLRGSLAPAGGPVALAVANLIPYKGHSVLLNAWREVCDALPLATLLLAGDGIARAELEAEARRLGLADRVRFLGIRRDVPDLLAISDVLVHPSFEEGFCNALLEAMAAGKPVVATDVGGNAEAVVDGVTGRIVPPRDAKALAAAVLYVLQSDDHGQAMGSAGRRRVRERFGRETMVSQYEAAYRAVLARKEVETHDVRNRGSL